MSHNNLKWGFKMSVFELTKTDESIWEAFFSLLDQEKFSAITVSQICQIARISRPTFYRHYVDKYALLTAINQHYAAILKKFITQRLERFDITQSLVEITRFFANQAEYILKLLQIHTSRSDLNELFKSMLRDEFIYQVKRNPQRFKLQDFPLEYLADLYVATGMVFLNYSLKHGLDLELISALNDAQKNIF